MLNHLHQEIFFIFSYGITHKNKVTNSNKRSGTSLQNQNIAKSHLPTLNNQISHWFIDYVSFVFYYVLPLSPLTPVKMCESESPCRSMLSMLSSVKKASVSGARVSNTQRVFWVDTDSLRTFSLINILSQAGCECLLFPNTIPGSEDKMAN